ncbi:hypothetical protein EQP59_00370 [Ornithobacterium rhinotracheale]|uniref:Glycosyltransferase family 1 protein n=1 Tax=Ornithobacterium rhinotracheale TaxID=28251 RepID=A0A3R5XTA9_ORNRH|nr:hypothetical protein [Ornithobacterium rhinotracheale]QAR29920.1 hypothetical protein EQP59_00370 [Ornithobacterium rhinotracheale]
MANYSKHILISDDDIVRYPPILSVLKILAQLNCHVTMLGYCSSKELIEELQKMNIHYEEVVVDKVQTNPVKKFQSMFKNKSQVEQFIKRNYDDDTVVWVFGNENGWRMNSIIKNYRTILYLFEMPFFKVPMKYRLVVPNLDLKQNVKSAWRVVCCEYNRAKITQAVFGLKKTPYIIPNKPLLSLENLSYDLSHFVDEKLIDTLKEKKTLLYQGAIDNEKRRIDYICDSLNHLGPDYAVCIMAADSTDKDFLKQKYKDKDVYFLPFIPPPYHLLVTKMAYIGFLTYNTSENSNVEESLNLLYCAPNKIYEYSMFNKPMIGNDVPALKQALENNQAGISTDEWNVENIVKAIKKIENNYPEYTAGSKQLYENCDSVNLIDTLIKK